MASVARCHRTPSLVRLREPYQQVLHLCLLHLLSFSVRRLIAQITFRPIRHAAHHIHPVDPISGPSNAVQSLPPREWWASLVPANRTLSCAGQHMVDLSGIAPESRNVFRIEDIRVFRETRYTVIRLPCQALVKNTLGFETFFPAPVKGRYPPRT